MKAVFLPFQSHSPGAGEAGVKEALLSGESVLFPGYENYRSDCLECNSARWGDPLIEELTAGATPVCAEVDANSLVG